MGDQTADQSNRPVERAVSIVVAYVSRNHVQASELPALIASVHAAVTSLTGLGHPVAPEALGPKKPTPAQIRKSITPDTLTSFINGKRYKTLRRHLITHGLSFDQYRTRYGLPADYPATSANYSMKRSALSRTFGLGRNRHKANLEAAAAGQAVKAPVTVSKPRGRKQVAETA